MILYNIVRKSLGGLADRVAVHAVRAGADDSAEAGCSELEVPVEAVLDFSGIVLDGGKLFFCLVIEVGVRTPQFVLLHCVHIPIAPFNFVNSHLWKTKIQENYP